VRCAGRFDLCFLRYLIPVRHYYTILSPCFTADVLHRTRRNRKRTPTTTIDLSHIVRCTAVSADQNDQTMVSPITPEAACQVWLFFAVALFVFIVIGRSLLDDPLTHVFVRVYCVAVDLMAQVRCYRAMLEVSRVCFSHTLIFSHISFLLAEPWCLGAPLPIGMPDDRDGNATPVFPYLGGYGRTAGHNLGALRRLPVM
jgi:hypothetical protein